MEKMTIMFGIVCTSSQTINVVGRNEMEKMIIMFGIVYTSSQTIDVVGINEIEKMTIMFGLFAYFTTYQCSGEK